MSIWSRIGNVFRGESVSGEIDEELEAHIAEAMAQGRSEAEARKAFGGALQHRESSRDQRILPWLDSLRADTIFGWRQLWKKKSVSLAAILSLGLAIGACTTAFRLTEAMLWRPLPVEGADRLYVLSFEGRAPSGKLYHDDNSTYPMFRQMRALVKNDAELIAISFTAQFDLTYDGQDDQEKATRQYVSGWMFDAFGIRPAAGRVLTGNDDVTPGAHAVAVISNDYWIRRFHKDPQVVGRAFRTGKETYQIVGVTEGPFMGTEPGKSIDIFVPTMMMANHGTVRSDYRWFRTYVKLKPGVNLAPVREKLGAAFVAFQQESVKQYARLPKREMDGYLSMRLMMTPAASGSSGYQRVYRTPLIALGALAALVLMIACGNVANLMAAQTAAREREMALRISIGAGRRRLAQLLLVECAWLAALSTAMGAAFAWWATQFVVGMIGTPDNPLRLAFNTDWREFAFELAVTLGTACLFGLGPAWRASSVKPAGALKGSGERSARPHLMRALLAAQVAFCFVVLFVSGLLVTTARRLTTQSTGFSSERLLTLETTVAQPQPAAVWRQLAGRLSEVAGVESLAIAEWPLMSGPSWSGFISVNGAAPGLVTSYFLTVSPEFRQQMKVPLLSGRDFAAGNETADAALVSTSFAKQYFGSEDPIGKWFSVISDNGKPVPHQIIGTVGDVRYRNMREAIRPEAYFPFQAEYAHASFLIRTRADDARSMVRTLRREVPHARPGFFVSNAITQTALMEGETTSERMLATLAIFFGSVALLLAGLGLYGVLDYSVLQRRRELGIRLAIGAQASDVAWRVTVEMLAMLLTGAAAGVALGLVSARYVESLLYDVKPTDWGALAAPAACMICVAFVAALPAVLRAVRIDPVIALRAE